MATILNSEVKFLPGVGDVRAQLLSKELGIESYEDLLYHFPFRYIDRTRIYTIDELHTAEGLLVQFRARIVSVGHSGDGAKRRFRVVAQDSTGAAELLWFRGVKWIEKRLEVGREYLIFGRVSLFRHEVSMVHPEIETIEKVLSRKSESKMHCVDISILIFMVTNVIVL